jgi:hypothetical protein
MILRPKPTAEKYMKARLMGNLSTAAGINFETGLFARSLDNRGTLDNG